MVPLGQSDAVCISWKLGVTRGNTHRGGIYVNGHLLRSTAKSVSNEFTVTLPQNAFMICHSENCMKTLFLLVAAGSESGQGVKLAVLLFPCKWRH